MARIRRFGTAPELALRRALHRAGYRYRLETGVRLPGKPDIVLPKFRLAIFVDGCFWHGCQRHGTLPKTNTAFWQAKILRNRRRDKQADQSLYHLGWGVVRVWEHEVKTDLQGIILKIAALSRAKPH